MGDLRFKIEKYINRKRPLNENDYDKYEDLLYEYTDLSEEPQLIQDLYKSFDDFEEYLKQFIKLENDWIDKIFYKFNPLYK